MSVARLINNLPEYGTCDLGEIAHRVTTVEERCLHTPKVTDGVSRLQCSSSLKQFRRSGLHLGPWKLIPNSSRPLIKLFRLTPDGEQLRQVLKA
jgi:hypothetical protein